MPGAFALTAVAFVTALVGPAAARISRHASSPAIVEAARAAAGPDVRLIAFRHYEPTLVYYSRGEVPFRWIGRTVHPLHQEGGCDVDFEWQFPVVEHFLRNAGFTETLTPYAKAPDPAR